MRTKQPISFQPIPCPGGGIIALQIYPPGTWFDDTDFNIFVGGSGVGHAPNMLAARGLLHDKAVEACSRRIVEAEDVADHYRKAKSRLVNQGLQEI